MGGVFTPDKPRVPVIITDNSEQKVDEERLKALERQRRGLESTIKTSYTGMLDGKNLNRKKLLGE